MKLKYWKLRYCNVFYWLWRREKKKRQEREILLNKVVHMFKTFRLYQLEEKFKGQVARDEFPYVLLKDLDYSRNDS
jgi:hypothetical protein